MKRIILATAALAALGTIAPAVAGVSAEEAAKLKGELTPLGAEKAGNKDGTIPAWTGGYSTAIPGDKPGGRRGDPFKDEKPLFSITGQNMAQYADKLSEGQQEMLKKYPDWRIDVYRTHRTAAAPQWVYDNTFKNASRARLDGDVPRGSYGGIPFPIPKNGAEVIWNHLLRWRGTSVQLMSNMYQITADGKYVLTTDGVVDYQWAYYLPEGSPETFEKSRLPYWQLRVLNYGPPIRAGEAITGGQKIEGNDEAWVYLAGQRRVRKLPNPCCDTPTPAAAGVISFDEVGVWAGQIDRFDWKLVGKKEMFIPYNGNKLMQPKTDAEVLGKHGANPDHLRWELHRVWVIEATLRKGQRHQSPKSRYYCDEDTWLCTLGDRWDANNQLARTLYQVNFVAPDLPGTVAIASVAKDFLSGSAFFANVFNSKPGHYLLKPRYPDSHFTGDALAGGSVR
jgi:hypothetical protein